MHLYKFDVPATKGPLPRTFLSFLAYVWRKNPILWVVLLAIDLVHYTRFPICFVILGKLIDVLQHSTPGNGLPAPALHLLLLMLAVLTVGELAHVFMSLIFIHWRPRLRSAIRSDFLNYTMRHSHTFFQDNFAGSLSRRISEVSEGTLRVHDILRNQIVFAIIQMASSVVIMTLINPIYGACISLFILSVIIPVFIRLPNIRQRSIDFSRQRSHVTGAVVDVFSNISAVKLFAASDYERQYHEYESQIESSRAAKLTRSMVQIEHIRRLSLIVLGGGGMTVLACYGWSQGWITVGQASSISTLSLMLTGAVWMLGIGIVQMVDESGNITDALNITTQPLSLADMENAGRLQVDQGRIHYNNTSFAYNKKPIFKNLNVKIAAGEKVALIGPSGAGKTTFVNLLLRLFDLQGGDILIDDQPISAVTQDSLREAIAVIPQDTILFHRSLMDNIRYGRRDARDEEVIDAARRAHAHEFIAALPEGYATMVGERGIKLSGGQRQRIAIARAILKNAPILILDEATSALDSESERLIQQALDELMRGKTVIAIAHRLSTIARMDRILVFEQGEIVEQGDHQALLNKHGLYARLWSMQSGGFLHEERTGVSVEIA